MDNINSLESRIIAQANRKLEIFLQDIENHIASEFEHEFDFNPFIHNASLVASFSTFKAEIAAKTKERIRSTAIEQFIQKVEAYEQSAESKAV